MERKTEMQLAGSQCCFCSQKIVLHTEATGCVGCQSVAHKDCLRAMGNACPKCGGAWRNIEEAMAYATRCPSCGGQARPSRSSRCSKCGSQTGWDSYTDYLMARHEIHRGGL